MTGGVWYFVAPQKYLGDTGPDTGSLDNVRWGASD